MSARLTATTERVRAAERELEAARAAQYREIRRANAARRPLSLREIAAETGLTFGRIGQIVRAG